MLLRIEEWQIKPNLRSTGLWDSNLFGCFRSSNWKSENDVINIDQARQITISSVTQSWPLNLQVRLIKKYRIKFWRYSCRSWSTYFCSYLFHPFVRKRLSSMSRFLFQRLLTPIKFFSHSLNFPRKRIWGLSELFFLCRVLHDKL